MSHPKTEFSLSILETNIEASCLFCPSPIVPGEDYWTAIIVIIPKKETYSSHLECFELFAWTATNFVFATMRGDESIEREKVLN